MYDIYILNCKLYISLILIFVTKEIVKREMKYDSGQHDAAGFVNRLLQHLDTNIYNLNHVLAWETQMQKCNHVSYI